MCPVNGGGEVATAAASDHQVEQLSNDVVLHPAEEVDDDGKPKRNGTVWRQRTHNNSNNRVRGSVTCLGDRPVRMDSRTGNSVNILFHHILHLPPSADCYRHLSTGKRNYTYMEAVNAYSGKRMEFACGVVQCVMLCGATIGYAITASMSML